MNSYELTFLINDDKEIENMKKLLDSVSAKIVEEQKWGKKELAYPINKQLTADYYIWKIDLDARSLSELKKKLNFNENLLRYLILRLEK